MSTYHQLAVALEAVVAETVVVVVVSFVDASCAGKMALGEETSLEEEQILT